MTFRHDGFASILVTIATEHGDQLRTAAAGVMQTSMQRACYIPPSGQG